MSQEKSLPNTFAFIQLCHNIAFQKFHHSHLDSQSRQLPFFIQSLRWGVLVTPVRKRKKYIYIEIRKKRMPQLDTQQHHTKSTQVIDTTEPHAQKMPICAPVQSPLLRLSKTKTSIHNSQPLQNIHLITMDHIEPYIDL